MSDDNRQVRLAARPHGLPTDDVWEHTTEPRPTPSDGQALVQTSYISLDPAMRGWMNEGRSYVPPVGLGEVMRAGTVGTVVESRAEGLAEGTVVAGMWGVQEWAAVDAKAVTPVDTSVADPPHYLGTLGMPGLTAYFGLYDVGALQDGDTVVVSGAAGAVGTTVGQLAKLSGARVVGIAGGPEKCAWVVDELGFDACVDYKADDFFAQLRAATPDRLDVYFDNVGGAILEAALARLNRGARIVVCGAISQYNATEVSSGPRNYMQLLIDRARMQGFVVFDFADRYAEGIAEMSRWYAEGKLRSELDVAEGGIPAFPETLLRLFKGENRGKLVLKA